ncbi:Hint domain-containing protein [Roseovarius sp. 2305UL8-3]|uniref:Hint domain-containing protein n=1 Tax=Roseovarius conchicola TaxID=3121636 RepID=UPI0035274232
MAGYISEFRYVGNSNEEFLEIALPEGTDPSGYMVHIYDYTGAIISSHPLGVANGTMGGHDVYTVDAGTPGFSVGNTMGNMYPDDAVALVDGSGNVQQFVSYDGNTVTGATGPAVGLTSLSVGSAGFGQSLQSDNGGAGYFTQSTPNQGSIPACYGPGTLIATPEGPRPVETLQAGDRVCTYDGTSHDVRWVWSGVQPLDGANGHQKPVLIKSGALGPGRPARDLVVSGQHRIAVGLPGQLDSVFESPCLVPAKALVCLRGVRYMLGKRQIVWHHLLCADHQLILADGVVSETLLLGPQILTTLSRAQRSTVACALGRKLNITKMPAAALPCLTVGAARRAFAAVARRAA